MNQNQSHIIEKLEADLWEAADNLRANSKLTSSDYFMPVLGIIFLRHAANRFDAATRQIEQDQKSGKMPRRKIMPADYVSRRALFLPETARYDYIMDKAATSGGDLPALVTAAMNAIEASFEPLLNVLPKGYGIFESKVLEDLMRTFNGEQIKQATGDVFGRIYEYFLAKFSVQKAHDNGEFFTPASIVQTIVNVIEPDHGTIFDPACGSGGMFVQSSHFIEHEGQDTMRRVVFYGQEKNSDTIRIAKMNLAVHGLEGKIAEAITYYQDEHSLFSKCDFVMANPPFNVDLVDAERVKTDPRLPFGLPGVNKAKKVSNGNYLWISYFWSYLSDKGRAGFVMSSQASSAGHGEKDVRRKIIETGDVDVMISIRSNFFYTRAVPCELWFIDRGKPDQPSSPALLPKRKGSHYRGGYDFSGLVERARELRKKQTPAEQVLWEMLRDRQLVGLKFRRQHQVGNYILDFYCHEAKLAVELDGAVHEQRRAKDLKRDAYLKSQGIQVLRIPNETLLHNTGSTLEQISALLPTPSGRGAGGEGQNVAHNHKGNVLMLDARNVYRKVNRKINDFSPEQLSNVAAIVWLYRGQNDRFLDLVKKYFNSVCTESTAIPEELNVFEATLKDIRQRFDTCEKAVGARCAVPLRDAAAELRDAVKPYEADRAKLVKGLDAFCKKHCKTLPATNDKQHVARKDFEPLAEHIKGLIKQVDLLYKLAARVNDCFSELAADDAVKEVYDRRATGRLVKQLDAERKNAVDQLKQAVYFHRQIVWLQDRFPKAQLQSVPGLVKLVSRKDIEAADWSLTPGRYVGVAPPEPDDDFDFEETLRTIHVELTDLNKEAAELAAKIQENFEELGI
jgi:type I restriction-modification system DNA methylase subunit